MDAGEILKAACDSVVAAEELRPEYSADGKKLLKSFCNIGARRVAEACGCFELDSPEENADVMHDLMVANASGRWKKVLGAEAVLHALDGGLAFAIARSTQLNEDHGHICAIRPESMQPSASAGHDVPIVANVGAGDPNAPLVQGPRMGVKTKRNWNCRVSEAFPVKKKGEPEYFIYV